MKVHVLLPCFNEAPNLTLLIEAVNKTLSNMHYQIVVVNDGSTDESLKVLLDLKRTTPLSILSHSQNLGLGEALETGLTYVMENADEQDVLVTMDSDMTHNPEYIPTMLEAISTHDLVICSRYVRGGAQLGVPLLRRILSRGISFLARAKIHFDVKDVTSGFRCFRVSLLKKMQNRFGDKLVVAEGFEVALELLIKANICDARIIEIPVLLDYDQKRGNSKIRLMQTVLKYLVLLLRNNYCNGY